MEVEEVEPDEQQQSKKHSAAQSPDNSYYGYPKKVRLFSAKEFRNNLREGNRVPAIKQFLNAINESNGHDYIFEYLENGGNCLELLQTLEVDSNLSPTLIFELLAHALLKITASGPQYHNEAFGTCRYLLNNYRAIINKMVGLSSSTQERKVCLKLLTAMVAFSSTLAKDVLLHINFYTANMELLTKNTGEVNSVRDHFIHFLTAFLIDGYYPSLSVLLDKKGFIASIIKGLQFDVADTVCIVISAMKSYILENQLVSKTAKMKVFNTLVVRDIVNLYNWKGPGALKTQGKNKTVHVTVDEYSKSKVSECVHDFLMVLCTSHKTGVIFKDPFLGLGKKNQNPLMYTVLESLDKPWEHSYASELVTKICVACPDLTKTLWNNLKPSLEPRLTQKWLTAMKFTKNLLRELQPSCIEFCAKDLTPNQLAQVIQILVAPLPILRTIISENHEFPSPTVKRHIISLVLDMLCSLNAYLKASEGWLSTENHRKLKTFITNHVTKHFLDANTILTDWEIENPESDNELNANISNEKFLEIVFDIFNLYNKLAPQLLDSLSSMSIQLTDFLQKLSDNSNEEKIYGKIQVKMINIFSDLEPDHFSLDTELFSYVLPLLFKFYYETLDLDALTVLNKLFKNTGIFYGCLHEINIWINGVLNMRHFNNSVIDSVLEILKLSANNFMEFSDELSLLKPVGTNYDIAEIIKKLDSTDLTLEFDTVIIKHKYLSPMVLGLINHLKDTSLTKSFKSYMNFVLLNLFHSQTRMPILTKLVKEYEILPENIKEYILGWTERSEITFFNNHKGRIKAITDYSEALLSESVENTLKTLDFDAYHDLPLNLLQASVFYLTNLANCDSTDYIFSNCSEFINHLVQAKMFHPEYSEIILAHPGLLDQFSVLHLDSNALSRFLLDIIKLLEAYGFDISRYLKIYREKLLKAILKIVKKPKKYIIPDFIKVLELFKLDYEQCLRVLTILGDVSSEKHSVVIFDILSYCLTQMSSLFKTEVDGKPLDGQVIQNLSTHFIDICRNNESNSSQLSVAFHEYLQVFPHHVKNVNPNLIPTLSNLSEYHKENVNLVVFLLERNVTFFDTIKDNIDELCAKRGVLLPILQVLVQKNVDESILNQIFNQFETSLTKALVKPQKAGQHYINTYRGLTVLVQKCMPLEKCKNLADKVQKFEVTEVFHVKLFETIFSKVIDNDVTNKQLNNIILTFIHLQIQVLKRNVKGSDTVADVPKLNEVAESFNNILIKIQANSKSADLKSTMESEILKSYITYCLKFGILGQTVLVKSLTNLVKVLATSMDEKKAKVIINMLLSHSKFFDVMLNGHSETKFEALLLFLILCQNWKEFMERFHVPMLLASYNATISRCDNIIYTLFKMYDENSQQTSFHDFKPFLWGQAAASHYSIKQNAENTLWRQPKMRDIMDILQEDLVLSTIVNYSSQENVGANNEKVQDIKNRESYDLRFMLPLFSQLLAPEQPVQTYAFTRSGALSLTVLAVSSENQKMREAAFHVLSRFHYHVDANQRGKDNLLWIRYVDAICKGVARLPEKKFNDFSAIYLARMALILTQPNHIMYVPLSQHLTAKLSLDFSTIPELYTFLHSSDVNYKEHRNFILELLRDGLKTEKDFTDFLRSMAFKLFSELYNSSLSDFDTKLLILDVILAACKLPLGSKMLCQNHSLLPQLFNMMNSLLTSPVKEKQDSVSCISKIIVILLEIGKILLDMHSSFMVFNVILRVVKDDIFSILSEDDKRAVFEVLYLVCQRSTHLFTDEVVEVLLEKSNDKFCKYVFKYGCEFIDVGCFSPNDVCYYLRLLIVHKMRA